MGSFRDALTESDQEWIRKQKVYFVATSPQGSDGHVNTSPKGYDSLRILNSKRIVLLDGRGSGCETISHLRENGRITIMMCAFEGGPRIMRLFGRGVVYEPGQPEFDELFEEHFASEWRDPDRFKFVRSIIDVQLELVGQSCGFAVPFMDYKDERITLVNHHRGKTEEARARSRSKDNTVSIDGIPSFLEGTDSGLVQAKRRASSAMHAMVPWVGGAALGAALAVATIRSTFK
ncbi:hypothetical protein IW139_001571 [Coemansia sp. RSA 353]|nr:hypothetical protein LPJ58_001098 [Coemansia sp. RSA 1591]KAJ1765881.1 hypothetical protein LPJ69_001094 [Coemansia sp. RSA 1752]KAJ1778808.1 hypothetical protein LPJ54_001424 [Coemansia sp. RSA 1824]KAJ1793134.1 hypothetical protein LPJ62_000428 [Coemansia sp. RSA 2167]KAJ1794003.1 hypothetical protein LPJ67_001037 [Coemansia sp. RSA 1938]KAJ2118830.1 hypothetical protein GGF48_004435 [Coemansia sp. RSA 921]KAJ2129875.1 hypothetical protein GGH17_003958 [Coemansia sp. RSA 788]KAJ2142927.